MRDSERLTHALAAATPRPRDHAFVLAVLERAEAERYRRHAARALMRGAGYAAAIAGLMAPLLALTPADVLAEGFAGSVLLAAFVLSARRAVRV